MLLNPPLPRGLDRPASAGPRLLLADHHCALDAAYDALRAAARADDHAALVASYRGFEGAVSEHIAAEEDLILPAYEAACPADAGRVRAQHVDLRNQLFALAVDVELHCVRVGQLDQLIATLREHAAREDRGMYPWAQVHLPLTGRRRLFVRLGRSLRTLAGGRRATRNAA